MTAAMGMGKVVDLNAAGARRYDRRDPHGLAGYSARFHMRKAS
jgi:hypothetical protein